MVPLGAPFVLTVNATDPARPTRAGSWRILTPMTQEALSGRTYAGQPVADRQRQRRARFLESGLTVFARDGYPNSSVGAICKVAGLPCAPSTNRTRRSASIHAW